MNCLIPIKEFVQEFDQIFMEIISEYDDRQA